MTKYYCTVIFDASSTVIVEANTPEEAAAIAEDKTDGNQHICHQCADTLETGDASGVLVHDEKCTKQLLDTTYRPSATVPEGWKLVPMEPTQEMIDAGNEVDDLYLRGTPQTWSKVYRAMLATAPQP